MTMKIVSCLKKKKSLKKTCGDRPNQRDAMTMKIVSCLKKLKKKFRKNVWRSTESARCDDHEDCFLPKKS